MSTYGVLGAVSKTLEQILYRALHADRVVGPLVGSKTIVFTNPTQTARESSNRLSIWLYQVTENEFIKNQPPPRRNGSEKQSEPPLALNLHYLITPFADTPDAEHLILGMVMQTLYDNAIIYMRQGEELEELRVVLCRLPLEELTRIWEALREPYRLSVCYEVRVARIDSQRVVDKERVVEAESAYGSVPEPETG